MSEAVPTWLLWVVGIVAALGLGLGAALMRMGRPLQPRPAEPHDAERAAAEQERGRIAQTEVRFASHEADIEAALDHPDADAVTERLAALGNR